MVTITLSSDKTEYHSWERPVFTVKLEPPISERVTIRCFDETDYEFARFYVDVVDGFGQVTAPFYGETIRKHSPNTLAARIVAVDAQGNRSNTIYIYYVRVQGAIAVYAYVNDVPVTATVEVDGLPPFTTPGTVRVDAGTYTVTAYYGTYRESKPVSVNWGETVTVEFRWYTRPTSVSLSASKTSGIAVGETVTFTVRVTGITTFSGKLYAYVRGVKAGEWPISSTTGVTAIRLVPSNIGTVVDWQAEVQGVKSNVVTTTVAVVYPTRISISAPDRVFVDEAFTISGKLEYQSEDGVWRPLAGRTVSLYYNTTKIADVTTGSDGSYSRTASIPSPGTYTLKAVYAGEGLGLTPAAESPHIPIVVGAWPAWVATALAALSPLIAVSSIIALNEVSKG